MRMLIAIVLGSWLAAVLFVLYAPFIVLVAGASFLAGIIVTLLAIDRYWIDDTSTKHLTCRGCGQSFMGEHDCIAAIATAVS